MCNCDFCEDNIFQDRHDKKYYMRVENSNWDNYNDCFDWTDIEINFCPQCGKDYRTYFEMLVIPNNPDEKGVNIQ